MSALQIDALWSGINNPTSGKSYSGAIVATFASGTSTPKAVWEDKDETLPSALGKSQFVLDSNGQAFVFGNGLYKINVYAPTDTGLLNPEITIDGAEYMTTTSKTLVLSAYGCNLETAITAIGSVNKTHLIIDCKPSDLAGNLVSPENITIEWRAGYTIGGAFTLTINGPLISGAYQLFDSDISLAGNPLIDHGYPQWTGAIGDGSTDDTDSFVKISAWLDGKKIIVPATSNSYKANFSLGGDTILEGTGYFSTIIRPADDNVPVITVPDIRTQIINVWLLGYGSGTSIAGIDLEDTARAAYLTRLKIQDFSTGITAVSHLYGEFKSIRFTDCGIGFSGNTSFNDNAFSDIKLSGFDTGILISTSSGTSDYSHGNLLEKITFEAPNANSIGFHFINSGGNTISAAYFEGFTNNSFPVLEAGGVIYSVHGGPGSASSLWDEYERDFTKLGLSVGDTIVNEKDGSTATITGFDDANATNDKILCSLSGGATNKFNPGDGVKITADVEGLTHNYYINPDFVNPTEPLLFLQGLSMRSDISASWQIRKDGDIRTSKWTAESVLSGVRTELDFSPQFTGYTSRFLGKVKISMSALSGSGSSGYVRFLRYGGDVTSDTLAQITVSPGQEESIYLDLPVDAMGRVDVLTSVNFDIDIFIHQMLGN